MPGDGSEDSHNNNNDDGRLPISVKGQDDVVVDYFFPHDRPLFRLMDEYCKRKKLVAGSVRFLYNGKRIRRTQTPAELGMGTEPGKHNMIDAFQFVHGGGFYCIKMLAK
ncbi:hypothetical protein Tsubulata_002535 [Turnera subulata]|uniref:Rad60/SUMO-like domain-containing protein n=1 Tax=Turnera subulata TaxID=218843 RepID=A0A9Q0GBL1_9ROSI|nr:hypothetical protein Tsubulata_002535 [Turnera subulata]